MELYNFDKQQIQIFSLIRLCLFFLKDSIVSADHVLHSSSGTFEKSIKLGWQSKGSLNVVAFAYMRFL